jgi:agmatine deiminase
MEQVTPKQQGFMMPAEWEKHSAVWLAWPHDVTTFTQGIDKAEHTFCQMIKAFEGSEKVEMLMLDNEMQSRVERMLQEFGVNLSNVNFHQMYYGDVWMRDYGPSFLRNDVWVKWQYNVYGKAHEDAIYWAPLLKDNDVFDNLNLHGQKFEPGIVMEGGSIEVNGKGSLITTEQCLLNPNRNSDLSREQIEKYLGDYLGVSKVIWLKRGLVNDHTDGHIDDIVRFVSESKILCCYEEDESDENYENLKDNYNTLVGSNDQDGKPFEVIKLPMPHMRYEEGHSVHSSDEANSPDELPEKAAVSYANFYIANNTVLVPVYNDPNDAEALEIIQSCFLDRKVVGIDCSNIIYGGGAIHCMTQQQPVL